jgi:very-short-patch-repair endonuclease
MDFDNNKPGYITANPKNYLLIKEIRDGLKNNPTQAEKQLWLYLKNKKTGYKIRRQHIIDDFIVDFVCLNIKSFPFTAFIFTEYAISNF